jgi:hypothetical protein
VAFGFFGPNPPAPEPLFSSLTAETFLKEILPWFQEKPGS